MGAVMKKNFALWALAVAAGGCHAEYNVVLLPTTQESPRDPCAFEVVDKFPDAGTVDEVGRLEVEFWPSHKLGDLKEAIKNDVCRIGVDVVVAEVQDGRINDAILYRLRAMPPPSAPHAGATTPPASTAPSIKNSAD